MTGSAATSAASADAMAGHNDPGAPGYIGPCPAAGDPARHYQLTVPALDVAHLGMPADSSPAAVGFAMHSHILAAATLVATARR